MKRSRHLWMANFAFLTVALAMACGGGGGGGVSATPTPPAATSALTVDAGDGQVTLNWLPVAGATSYNIYKATTAGVTKATGIKAGSSPTATSTLTGLVNGSTYYWTVTAISAAGESGMSMEKAATPSSTPPCAAPRNVLATAGSAQASISWDPSAGAASYNIYYGLISGITKTTGTKVVNAVSPQVITGLANAAAYYFVVTAMNANGESSESFEATATPSAVPAPAAPSGVSATAGDGQVTLSWNSVSGATAYNLYWGTTTGVTKTSGTQIANVASPHIHSALTNGTQYFYIITALNATGESVASAQASATPVASGSGFLPSSGILFASTRDGFNGIWVMNTDGSNPRRLSSVYKNYFGDNYPSSSMDGAEVVFTRMGQGVVVMDQSGEKVIKSYAYGQDAGYTTWSKSGMIYYSGLAGGKHYIYAIHPDGTGMAQVSPSTSDAPDPDDYHPSVSPNGLNLLFSTNRPGNVGIVSMPLATGGLAYLTYVLGDTTANAVVVEAEDSTWSPDGTKIAFAAYPGYPDFTKPEQIYVMNPDGSGKTRLTNGTDANSRFPSWSPDGTSIVFQKDYPSFSGSEVWIMNSDGTGAKALTNRNVTFYDAVPCFIKKPR